MKIELKSRDIWMLKKTRPWAPTWLRGQLWWISYLCINWKLLLKFEIVKKSQKSRQDIFFCVLFCKQRISAPINHDDDLGRCEAIEFVFNSLLNSRIEPKRWWFRETSFNLPGTWGACKSVGDFRKTWPKLKFSVHFVFHHNKIAAQLCWSLELTDEMCFQLYVLIELQKIRIIYVEFKITNFCCWSSNLRCVKSNSTLLHLTTRISNYSLPSWVSNRFSVAHNIHCSLRNILVISRVPHLSWIWYESWISEINFTHHCKLNSALSDISAPSTDLRDCGHSDVASERNYSTKVEIKVEKFAISKFHSHTLHSEIVQRRLSWCHSPPLHIPVLRRCHPRTALSDHKHCKSTEENLIKFLRISVDSCSSHRNAFFTRLTFKLKSSAWRRFGDCDWRDRRCCDNVSQSHGKWRCNRRRCRWCDRVGRSDIVDNMRITWMGRKKENKMILSRFCHLWLDLDA